MNVALITPTTRSPGKIVLLYTHAGDPHRCGVNYLQGQGPIDAADAADEAESLKDLLIPCCAPTVVFSGWEFETDGGVVTASGTLTGTVTGSSAVTGSDYKSRTTTLGGRGQGLSLGVRVGRTRLVLFNGNTFGIAPGDKRAAIASGTAFGNLLDYLDNNERIWADHFGQKAKSLGYATVQFNASAQARLGS